MPRAVASPRSCRRRRPTRTSTTTSAAETVERRSADPDRLDQVVHERGAEHGPDEQPQSARERGALLPEEDGRYAGDNHDEQESGVTGERDVPCLLYTS